MLAPSSLLSWELGFCCVDCRYGVCIGCDIANNVDDGCRCEVDESGIDTITDNTVIDGTNVDSVVNDSDDANYQVNNTNSSI